jgi:hypothetical protein
LALWYGPYGSPELPTFLRGVRMVYDNILHTDKILDTGRDRPGFARQLAGYTDALWRHVDTHRAMKGWL